MNITNRKLAILAVAAVGLLVVTIALYSGERGVETTSRKGALLIQGLDPASVARIVIEGDGKAATLVRGKDGYAVAERAEYPASMKKVNDLFIKCLEVRVDAKITDSPGNFEELGVAADKAAAASVTFADADGKTLVGLIVGKPVEKGGGNYVRLAGSNDVYASENYFYIGTGPAAYMDTSIVSVPKTDVRSVTVGLEEGTYTVARDDNGTVRLMDIPEGKRAKEYDVESVSGALASLSFTDVNAADAVKPEWRSTFTCRTNKHVVYVLQAGKLDGKDVVTVRAEGPSEEEIRKSSLIKEDEAKSELEKKDAVLTAATKAREFNARHGRWVYEISEWQARNLHRPLSDLVEDIPKPKEEESSKSEEAPKSEETPQEQEAPKEDAGGTEEPPKEDAPAPAPEATQ